MAQPVKMHFTDGKRRAICIEDHPDKQCEVKRCTNAWRKVTCKNCLKLRPND